MNFCFPVRELSNQRIKLTPFIVSPTLQPHLVSESTPAELVRLPTSLWSMRLLSSHYHFRILNCTCTCHPVHMTR